VLNLAKEKAEGKEISVSQTPPQRSNVIDAMEALKKSLGSVPLFNDCSSQKSRDDVVQERLSRLFCLTPRRVTWRHVEPRALEVSVICRGYQNDYISRPGTSQDPHEPVYFSFA